jgi:putative transport protein
MQGVFAFLASQPFLLVFLVVGGGYGLGRLSYRGIGLGTTGATLLVGLLVSLAAVQFGVRIELPDLVSAIFFNLFVFAIGLRVGPQFLASFERSGKPIVVVALFTVVVSCLIALGCGWVFDLPEGAVAGVLAGAGTSSPAFGAAQSAIRASAGPDEQAAIEPILTQQATAFAIGYVIGMVGLVVFIRYLPRMFRTDARAAGRELQAELDAASPFEAPGTSLAYLKAVPAETDVRVFRLERPELIGVSILELKQRHPRIVVEQIRRGGQILPPDDGLRLAGGDELVLAGMIGMLLEFAPRVGPEIENATLRDIEYETADIVVSSRVAVGQAVSGVMTGLGHGCYLRALFRMGDPIVAHPQLPLERNDVLRVIGHPRHTHALERSVGTAVRQRLDTDILTLAIGLVIGSFIGALQVEIRGVEIGLGAAGGLMLAAIGLSAIRARHPSLGGPVPESARRMFEDIGVVLFVAVLGLNTGATLPEAFAASSPGLLIVSVLLVTFLPPILGWVLGVYVLKINPVFLLGSIAGSNQSSAALRVAEEETRSDGPALGFPVAFAVGTVALSIAAYFVALIE